MLKSMTVVLLTCAAFYAIGAKGFGRIITVLFSLALGQNVEYFRLASIRVALFPIISLTLEEFSVKIVESREVGSQRPEVILSFGSFHFIADWRRLFWNPIFAGSRPAVP